MNQPSIAASHAQVKSHVFITGLGTGPVSLSNLFMEQSIAQQELQMCSNLVNTLIMVKHQAKCADQLNHAFMMDSVTTPASEEK
jgi:hypothetical protein